MGQHMLSSPPTSWVDPRKTGDDAVETSGDVGPVIFTANAGGTTTTIVGANATLSTGANVVRVGEKAKVFNSDGTLQQELVVEVTSVAAGGSTTVTFTPALSSATASGDTLRAVAPEAFRDNDSLDARLVALGYTQANVDKMNQNDKLYAIRLNDDPGSF